MPDPISSSPRAPRSIMRWWTWLVAVILAVVAVLIGWGGVGSRPLAQPRGRAPPALGGRILPRAIEKDVFVVRDGPRDSDGYTWWYLEGLIDQSRKGWGVPNYLGPGGRGVHPLP